MAIPESLAELAANFNELQRTAFFLAVGGFIRGAHNMTLHGPSPSGKTTLAGFLIHALKHEYGDDCVHDMDYPASPSMLHTSLVSPEPAPLAVWRSERTTEPGAGSQFGQLALIMHGNDAEVAECGAFRLLAGPARIDNHEYVAWNAPVLIVSNTPLQGTKAFVAEHNQTRPLVSVHMPPVEHGGMDPHLFGQLQADTADIIVFCTSVYDAFASSEQA